MLSRIPFGRVGLAVALSLAVGSVARGQTAAVSINFTATGGPNPGANLQPSEVAGFVPLANWNNVDASNATTSNLINHTGASTGVSVTIAGSTNSWSIPAANLPSSGGVTTPDGKMMQGYVDTSATSTTTITLTGLNAAGFT